jgi:hypothetical protein
MQRDHLTINSEIDLKTDKELRAGAFIKAIDSAAQVLDNMYHVDAHDVLRGSIYARIREGHLNLQ